MSKIARKKRPLTRETSIFRDDRLFIIACDDTYAPKQYFGFFQLVRVKVYVIETEDGTSAPRHVLNRLLQINHEPDDELWLILDTDHHVTGTHRTALTQVINEARERNVMVALSRPCFELWLLLHHEPSEDLTKLANARDTEELLRVKLGEYNKTSLKRSHYPLSSVYGACVRAEELDTNSISEDIPSSNATRVYRLWRALVAKALPTQLPHELRGLASK